MCVMYLPTVFFQWQSISQIVRIKCHLFLCWFVISNIGLFIFWNIKSDVYSFCSVMNIWKTEDKSHWVIKRRQRSLYLVCWITWPLPTTGAGLQSRFRQDVIRWRIYGFTEEGFGTQGISHTGNGFQNWRAKLTVTRKLDRHGEDTLGLCLGTMNRY